MYLQHTDFENALHQEFRIRYNENEFLPVVLTSVTLLPDSGRKDAPRRPGFALIFQSSTNAYLPQATYRFTHDQLGEHNIFIVPLGPSPDGMRYEAIFN